MHINIHTPKPPVDAPATCMVGEPLAVEASTEGLGVREPMACIADPEPAADYVTRRLASDAHRLRLDSHRPQNDTRRTQELPAVDWEAA